MNKAALDRITFKHGTAIDDARVTAVDFSPMNPEPNVLYAGVGSYAIFGCSASLTVGVDPANLKIELERPTREGERYYGLYRSARQSASPIEEFMHLYNILLMLFNDKQSEVDSFIAKHEPAVPQTQNPIKKPGLMETIYTRLRNEFAHKRDQVDLVITKKEMVDRLGGLVDLVRRAIELAQ